MTHLTPQQFVDAVEGTLPSSLSAHLQACEACRDSVAGLGSIATRVRDVEMPEPSPLFWSHFSARVRAATETEPIRAASWWRDGWKPLTAACLATATMALVLVMRSEPSVPVTAGGAGAAVAAAAAGPVDAGRAQPWDAVTEAASGLPARDVQLVARPTTDTAAAAISELSPAQQAEFVRLLKAEMARTGRSE
jgi:hypothetical protein